MSLGFGREGEPPGGGLGSVRLGADRGTASWTAKEREEENEKTYKYSSEPLLD